MPRSQCLSVEVGAATGPPLLLLHGIPGSHAIWKRVVRELAGRYQTIVPDLLGFGSSPPYQFDGHALEQAESLLNMLDDRQFDRVHVAGFDFGGPIAVQLYRLAPQRVLSLTLAATNVFTDTPIPFPLRIARIPVLGEIAFRAFFGKLGLALMWFMATGQHERYPFREFAEVLRSAKGMRTTRHIFFLSLRDLGHFYGDIEATLPRIDVPASVVWGDRDPFFAAEIGRRVADSIPGASFTLLPGCGHFVPMERAAELTAILEGAAERGEQQRYISSKMAKSRRCQ